MEIIAIIPARMGSSRFPGKPLADIHGVPMVGHVMARTAMCGLLSATYVATCDQVIMDYVAAAGGRAGDEFQARGGIVRTTCPIW